MKPSPYLLQRVSWIARPYALLLMGGANKAPVLQDSMLSLRIIFFFL
jgi:hypothetical protein